MGRNSPKAGLDEALAKQDGWMGSNRELLFFFLMFFFINRSREPFGCIHDQRMYVQVMDELGSAWQRLSTDGTTRYHKPRY